MFNKERLLNTFCDYVRIDSESTHEKAMAERLIADLTKLGCEIYIDNSMEQTKSDIGNLYCTLPGTAPGEPLILSAHMDTVAPGVGVEPVIEDGYIYSKGNTVLGSDNKAAVAAIMEVFRTLAEQNLPHPTLQAVFTVAEELHVVGANHLEYDKLVAQRALVLDCTGDVGTVITQAPGLVELSATVTGRSAHAGIAPETGISALQTAADAISRMKLLRVDHDTTANLGTCSCHYSTTVVPEQVYLQGEARSLDPDKLEQQVQHMRQCLEDACKKFGAVLDCHTTPCYYPFTIPHDDSFLGEVHTACGRLGLPFSVTSSGGGSDANCFNRHGVKALVLGIGMERIHSTRERISIQNLENLAALVLELVRGD